MNQTNIQVPRTAKAKEKMALPHRVELGMNSSASRMPNCAEEMVAPVVGETNLFMQSLSTWLVGHFSMVLRGRYEIVWLTVPLVVLAFLFANHTKRTLPMMPTINSMGSSYGKITIRPTISHTSTNNAPNLVGVHFDNAKLFQYAMRIRSPKLIVMLITAFAIGGASINGGGDHRGNRQTQEQHKVVRNTEIL